MYPVATSVECDGDLRPEKGFNWVAEHRVDVAIVQLDSALVGWRTGASEDEVDHSVLLLEVAWGSVALLIFLVSPGQVVSAATAAGASGATQPIAVV